MLLQSLYSDVYASNPAGSSFKVVEHICQLYSSNTFRKFNYGTGKNYLVYGTPSPPEFNFTNTKVNIYLYAGNSDAFVDPKDLERIIKAIPNQIKGVTWYDHEGLWAHNDYLFGNNVQTLVNPLIIERMNENIP